MNKNKARVGDRVKLKGKKNYREVTRIFTSPYQNKPAITLLNGIKGWSEEAIEFIIPKGTKVPLPFTSYEPAPDPQSQVTGVEGLRAALDASTAEQVQLRKRIKDLEYNSEQMRRAENEAHTRACQNNERAATLEHKCRRLAAIVNAYVEGRLS
jgi:hypothetical protein